MWWGMLDSWGYGGYGPFHMVVWIILSIAIVRYRVAPTIGFLVSSGDIWCDPTGYHLTASGLHLI